MMGRQAREIPATAFRTVNTFVIYTAVTKCSSAFQPIKMVKTSYTYNNTHMVLWSTLTVQGQKLLTTIEAHLKDGAGTALITVLPMKAANSFIMYNVKQITSWLPEFEDN